MKDEQKEAVTDALFNITEITNDLGTSYKNVSILQKGSPNANFLINFSLADIRSILHQLETARINLRYLQKEGEPHEPQ